MAKFLATTLFLIWGGLSLVAQDRLAMPVTGSPVVTVTNEGVAWDYPQASGPSGTIDWSGAVPTNFHNPREVSYQGSAALAVIGTRNGKEGLYVLAPVWGGAELAEAGPWWEAPTGEAIVDYRWVSQNPDTVIVWTDQSAWGRTSQASSILQDQTSLFNTANRAVTVLSWTEYDTSRWALVDLAETNQGWAPSIRTFRDGQWTLRAVGDAVSLPGTSRPQVSVTHPVDGHFAVAALRGTTWAQWAWGPGGPQPPLVWSLDSVPRAASTSLPDRPALFWWVAGGRTAGLVTPRLGTSQPVPWSQPLPGTLVWSSDLLVRSEGWRIWLMVEISGATALYRLDVRTDGWSALDRVGDLPPGTTGGTLALDDGRWSLEVTPSGINLSLEPDIPRLSETRTLP